MQRKMEQRKRDGNCLFVFARVCRGWRKAQLKVGAPLCTRVVSDVIAPGSVTLAKWMLAEGCVRDCCMPRYAALHGHLELVKWLCGEGGFGFDVEVVGFAARQGLPPPAARDLVQWLRTQKVHNN